MTPDRSRILLIDDDPHSHEFVAGMLDPSRVEVVWKACGRDGLLAFGNGPWNLVIVDYQLPDMLGTELLEALRQQDRRIPVVMFTGFGTIDLAVQAMKRGAVDFFTKPLTDPADFVRFLNRTLKLGVPLPLPQASALPAFGVSAASAAAGAGAAETRPAGGGGLSAYLGDPAALRDLVRRLDPPVALSLRESEVLAALLRGQSNKEIGSALFLSERTIKNHLTHVYGKFGVDSRPQLFNRILTAVEP